MNKKEQAIQLRQETGCSLKDCLQAIIYCEAHPDCLPLAYLKAKTLAVYYKGSFDDKVKWETQLLNK